MSITKIMEGGNGNGNTASIETILVEYTIACQIYGCHQRINAGILATFRYQLP